MDPPAERTTRHTPQPFSPLVENAVGTMRVPLGWLWQRGFRFLFILDAVGLFTTMVFINILRFGWDWPTYPKSYYFVGFSVATAIHLAVNYFAGMYEREPRLGYRPWLPRATVATAVAVLFDGVLALVTSRYLMPRLNLAILFVLASIGLTANRTLARRLANRRQGPSRVFLVGAGDAVRRATVHFRMDPDVDVVGTSKNSELLYELASTDQATDVLMMDLEAFNDAFPEPLTLLDRAGIGVHQRVSARETLLGLQSVREIAGMPFTRVRTHAMAAHQLYLKRIFDLTLLIISAPLTIPVIVVLGVYVKIVAGSPVLFRQTRVGMNSVNFTVVKFRTMIRDAEAAGPQLSNKEDGRVIPKLRWLRATRADELPQLWNVLRGEMSLVGPRPERPELIEAIEQDVAGYARRHELPPGLTGFAQVQGRYSTDADYKLGYDLQYLVNWSIVLDVQILFRTAWVVLTRRV